MLQAVHRKGYKAPPVRRVWVPKPGKPEKRPIGVPCIADRALQRSVVEVLPPYEQDFLPCSYGGRARLSAHHALSKLNEVIAGKKVRWVLEADLNSFFCSLDHGWILRFVKHRIGDPRIINLIQRWLKAGVLEDEELQTTKLGVTLNLEKTRQVDLKQDESFSFLGFVFRRTKTKQGKWGIMKTPKMDARTRLLQKLKAVFRGHQSQPIARVIYLINPILRGWVNYYRIGNSSRCFTYVKDWVEKKARRHLMKARRRQGFGWGRWSREGFYQKLGLYSDYKIRYYPVPKVSPAR